MSNESRMMFASIAEDHARSDHEALADTAMSVTEQLEADNQRELGLLAVIDDILSDAFELCECDKSTNHVCKLCYYTNKVQKPSQALREHEAKVLVDYISALRKQPSIGLSERQFGELKRVAEERRKK